MSDILARRLFEEEAATGLLLPIKNRRKNGYYFVCLTFVGMGILQPFSYIVGYALDSRGWRVPYATYIEDKTHRRRGKSLNMKSDLKPNSRTYNFAEVSAWA